MTWSELIAAYEQHATLSFEYACKPGARMATSAWEPDRVVSLQREGYIINVRIEA